MGAGRRAPLFAVVILAVVGLTMAVTTSRGPAVTIERFTVEVPGTADGDATAVALDAALYVPSSASSESRLPTVLLAHGFLGDRTAMDERARDLARGGRVVLTWSSRGFGASGGRIGLAARDAEVADVSVLIDVLARRDDVLLDAPGDPRVAVVGASHGGGVALMAAAHEPRLDAVVALAGWHDLGEALAPGGVLKTAWAGLLFTAQAGPVDDGAPSPCGAFSMRVCDAYLKVATTGLLTDDVARQLATSSPAGHLDRVTAPTLLVQGTEDSLFGLDQSVAAAAEIAASGTPVRQRWVPGDHDQFGGSSWPPELVEEIEGWLDRWLIEDAANPVVEFTWTEEGNPAGSRDRLDLRLVPDGLLAADEESAPPTDGDVVLFGPPGGQPAARTVLPGAGAFGRLLPLVDIPGQHAHFTTDPRARDVVLFGTPRLTLDVDATGPASNAGESRLFVRLHDVAADGTSRLVNHRVTPVRVSLAPARIEVDLGTVAHRIAAGHRLRLTIATTDQAFANVTVPTTITLTLGAASRLTLPLLPDVPDAPTTPRAIVVVAALVAGVLLLVGRHRRLRARSGSAPSEEAAHGARIVPGERPDDTSAIVFGGLTKRYADGPTVVQGLDLVVERGQVMGLLGPNGAGKTSTLRMLVGLTHPTSGTIDVFGHRMHPGHPVLNRVGSLIEGPGFVPELSGLDNLRSYWQSGERPLTEAHLPWVLDVADLGDDIRRPVRSYSHGMRQRLGIAQALLGRPDLLVLDEPTDGLDPEQIVRLRRLLRDLGTQGHTVLVSSHLLAEVEQTCTHVAVMHRGTLRIVGPVDAVVRGATTVRTEADDPTGPHRAHGNLEHAFLDLTSDSPPEVR